MVQPMLPGQTPASTQRLEEMASSLNSRLDNLASSEACGVPDTLRARFSRSMSDMYKKEVPLYGNLISIVNNVDDRVANIFPLTKFQADLAQISTEKLPARHRVERHGAIRMGTAQELRTITKLFAIFNMYPVGYYDLSVVGFPLHSTAFRPLTSAALASNPFRVFTTLLRADLLSGDVRALAENALSKRKLFTDRLLQLMEKAETEGCLSATEQDELITESLEIFRWHPIATVTKSDYNKMNAGHPMIADIASFRSAHINHLTPRTLDIDVVQQAMLDQGIPAKERIEGPPQRKCPILLRQTSFKALEEPVKFDNGNGVLVDGCHTARFGEVEQRGAAVTRKGRELYDRLLAETNAIAAEKNAKGSVYYEILQNVFHDYPDDWSELQSQGLVFFSYRTTIHGMKEVGQYDRRTLSELVAARHVDFEPLVYEDFLPFSAAGIFTSNLKSSVSVVYEAKGNRALLERDLGVEIHNEMDLYEHMQAETLEACRIALGLKEIVLK
ncbi:hypothetical protein RBB50_012486 [Rhinocladiella similis]